MRWCESTPAGVEQTELKQKGESETLQEIQQVIKSVIWALLTIWLYYPASVIVI